MHAVFGRSALRGTAGVVGEIFGDGKSWHGENLLLAHQAHSFVAEVISMIDRDHAGARGVKRPRFAGCVDGHTFAGACGFFDSGT